MAPQHPAWDSFERAFTGITSGAVRQCVCGRTFYNPKGGWDWEDGELEMLEQDKTATGLDWSCGEIRIDGVRYALDCECWHERGLRILRWLTMHDQEVAAFLRNEKKRKELEAERAPVVEE